MTFFNFLDTEFSNRTVEMQTEFSVRKDGECKAVHFIIACQRRFFTVIGVFKLIGQYFLIQSELLKPSENKLAAARDAKKKVLDSMLPAKPPASVPPAVPNA